MRRSDVGRVVIALIADELGVLRKRPLGPEVWSRWGPETGIDEDGVGVDSLDRLSLVARVNEFFHLHEVGSEDYLVIRRSLGEWVGVVCETLGLRHERLSFRTSGSTGAPKLLSHSLGDLREEVRALDGFAPRGGRILSFLPPHHIYGWLVTVGLAAHRNAAVLDLRASSPSRLRSVARPGDLVAATPFHWELLLRMGGVPQTEVVGFTAAAPMPSETWRALEAAGLRRLIEIYGSSETAGVGWRDAPEQPFQLFPYWRWDEAAGRLRRDGREIEPPDDLAFRDGGFFPCGRRDGAVQVGGVNVFPERVRATLLQHPWVRDCAVRLDGEAPESRRRLKAFVLLGSEAAEAEAESALQAWCREKLSAPERPGHFRFGHELPKSELGKAADWAA